MVARLSRRCWKPWKTWYSYEAFFHSFIDAVPVEGREKAIEHLKELPLCYVTMQEKDFISEMVKRSGMPKGVEEGSDCNRHGCFGSIYSKADSDMSCTCYNYAPCAKCAAGTYCPECDWDSDEDC